MYIHICTGIWEPHKTGQTWAEQREQHSAWRVAAFRTKPQLEFDYEEPLPQAVNSVSFELSPEDISITQSTQNHKRKPKPMFGVRQQVPGNFSRLLAPRKPTSG